jgi:hypothetical protein
LCSRNVGKRILDYVGSDYVSYRTHLDKSAIKNSTALDERALNSDQQALKIVANSTSYGIFIEMIVGDLAAW